MTTDLKKGSVLESGFEILEVKDLEEFEAKGIWARHIKSGAEVFHVLNDDKENLFSFAFATPSRDSTGAAHILEHSVLCGSQSFPLKDAFIVLAQGSLQTFLNAWTFPDKTVYPASSVNEQDYFNLMSVYGDAVFRPLLTEWTFMQEGHRLLIGGAEEGRKGKLEITGVVYNEMKGAYSSLETYAGHWSVKSVLQGTPYDFESGGDPECIPDLSWEGLKDFHRSCYSPANCRIFLAGNIPTGKQLDFLDKNFFSSLPPGNRNEPIKQAERWKSPKSFTVPCPSGSDSKPTVLLSWLCGNTCDTDGTLALTALTEILLGHDGSPLTMALIDSGLGEDLSPVSGLEAELMETSFCAGIRGLGETEPRKVEELILGELERLERDGIPKEEIEAALLGMEFSNREIRRSGGPFSLVWMRRSLRSWLHGGKPWDSLLFARPFTELKRRLGEDGRYFEKMIRRYLLDNPHRAFIVIEPREDFLAEKDASLARLLDKKETSMTEAEKDAIVKKNADLVHIQEKEDSPEALASIPYLSRKDLSTGIEIIEREYADAAGAPMLVHPLFTNGISYVDLAFPLDLFSPDDYLWFPLFARTVVSMGLPGMDYGEVSTLLARTAGGFYGMLYTSSRAEGTEKAATLPSGILDIRGRDWIIFRLKALDEKIVPSLDLTLRLITEADFSDLKRLKDLVLEMKNELCSNLAPSGHLYASGCSGRLFSRSQGIDELWNGLDQILFSFKLTGMDIAKVCSKLRDIQTRLVEAGVLVNLISSAPEKTEKEIGKRFGRFGVPVSRSERTENAESFFALSQFSTPPPCRAEVFSSPSLQVGFAAMTLRAEPYASPLRGAEAVLSHQLSTGALWEEIRMKGGAYGAFVQANNLEGRFSFSTYRDPDPLRSLETFSSMLKEAGGKAAVSALNLRESILRSESIDKAVIGAYAPETCPRTPAEKGFVDFLRFLTCIEDSHRSRRLKDLVAVSAEQIGAVLERLAGDSGPSYPVIITEKADAEKAAASLGVEPRMLPA